VNGGSGVGGASFAGFFWRESRGRGAARRRAFFLAPSRRSARESPFTVSA
jgi:hypothetical protein